MQCLTDPDTGRNYSDIGIPSFNPPLVRVGGYWAFEEPSNKAELFSVVRQVSRAALASNCLAWMGSAALG